MWTILKFDKKRLNFLKNDLSKKLGKETIFYQPKFKLKGLKRINLIITNLISWGIIFSVFIKNLRKQIFVI